MIRKSSFYCLILIIYSSSVASAIGLESLASVWNRLNLGQTCNNAGFRQCKIEIENKDEVNAYAKGDGNIYVFTGLLQNIQTEDELAFIVAHEMAHNIYKHPQNRLQDVGWATLANKIAQFVIKNNNTKMLIDGVSTAITATYTRSQEQEADSFAIKTIFNAGYNPVLAANFFSRKLGIYKSQKTKFDKSKSEIEAILYQGETLIIQKKAQVNQMQAYVKQAETIYIRNRSPNAYNQYMQYLNNYNWAVSDLNNTMNQYNSNADLYKKFMADYIKSQSLLIGIEN